MTPAQPVKMAQVGIVLVNYNGMAFMPECLETLSRSEYRPVKIVLVDNGSRDGSAAWAEAHFPEIVVLEQGGNRGFTGGCNAGMEWCLAAGCDYVLLLNNDTAVEPDFLSRLMDHADPNCLVVPKIYFYDDRTLINSHVGRYDYWRGLHQDWFYRKTDSLASRQVQFAQMANGCALLIPKEILQRVGMLDEQFFMYAEDVDFITRAVRAGAKILFVPDAVIYHRESSSSGGADSPLSVYYNNRNRPRLLFKHQKNPLARTFFVLYFSATRLATSLRYLRRGQRAQLSALWHGVADALRGRMGIAPQQREKQGL